MAERLKRASAPMWKRTLLQNLDYRSISDQLEEIAESGDYYGYSGPDMGEYYEEYRPLFDELSFGATELQEGLTEYNYFTGDELANKWDDCTVALLGDIMTVNGYEADGVDYRSIAQFEQDLGVEEAEKRLLRLSKKELISLFRRVMTTIVCYADIKGSYDTLAAVVNELDERAAIMQNGQTSARMWTE